MAEENRGVEGILELRGVSLNLRLGLHSFERIDPRTVPVDIVRKGPLFRGDIPAVDYSRVCSLLAQGLRGEYLYVEELACDVLRLLCEEWGQGWTVTVRKPLPPLDIPVEEAAVIVCG